MNNRNCTHWESSFAGQCNHRHRVSPTIFLVDGKGTDIDLEDVREGDVSIKLARLTIDLPGSSRPLVKIDFSTIIEVEDENEVKLVIALKRKCRRGDSVTLEQYELKFDDVEQLPFSFTYVDDDVHSRRDCHRECIYTVVIDRISVKNGSRVDELETRHTAINAVVQTNNNHIC